MPELDTTLAVGQSQVDGKGVDRLPVHLVVKFDTRLSDIAQRLRRKSVVRGHQGQLTRIFNSLKSIPRILQLYIRYVTRGALL